jgi:hypothetical protein
MTLYHCTSWGVYSTLRPSIPENQFTKAGIVDTVTPRISVAPTFFQCMLSSIMNDIGNKTQMDNGYRSYSNDNAARSNEAQYFEAYNMRSFILVYKINIQKNDSSIYKPTSDDVYDVSVSDEIWIKRELKFPEIKLHCIVRKAYPLFIELITVIKPTKKAQAVLGVSEIVCPNDALFSIDALPDQNSFSEYKSLLEKIHYEETQYGFQLKYN